MTVFNDLMSMLSLALNEKNLSEKEIKDRLDELNNGGLDWEKLAVLAKENSVIGMIY